MICARPEPIILPDSHPIRPQVAAPIGGMASLMSMMQGAPKFEGSPTRVVAMKGDLPRPIVVANSGLPQKLAPHIIIPKAASPVARGDINNCPYCRGVAEKLLETMMQGPQ